jgi:PadR family transcriptional regulator PadR
MTAGGERMFELHEMIESLTLELRRGTVVLFALSQLKQPKYGYMLVQILEEKGVSVDAGTLYPLLRRLEKQGILKSEWETASSKPRKYYVMTDFGLQVYQGLCKQWSDLATGMESLLQEEEGGAI